MCAKYQPDWSTHTWVIEIFLQSVRNDKEKKEEKEENEKMFMNICWFISWEWLEGSYLSLECGVNLVPFGAIWRRHYGAMDTLKSWLCCFWYTHSVCAHPVFLGHTLDMF